MNLLDRFRDWLEARGWWYGRLKPCACPRDERYWGLYTTPPDSDQVDEEYRTATTETDAATITEWKPTRIYRCRKCGETFEDHLGVTVARRTEYEDGTETAFGLDALE